MKILHFSDIHARDKDIKEIEKCLNFIVETARAEEPDIIINAGDTFDSADIKADSLSAKLIFKIFKELADIAPVAIILGTPSHDGQIADTLRYVKARYQVRVSTHPEQLYLADSSIFKNTPFIPAEVVISMLPAVSKQFFNTDSGIMDSDAEIAAELSKIFLGFAAQAAEYNCPHVLVYHGTIRGAAISETQVMVGRDLEIGKDQIEMSGCHATLCGHIHFPQRLANSNIFYSGSIASLNYGEIHGHGFYIHEFEGKKLTDSRFIKTPSRKLIKLSEDLTGASDVADLSGIPLMEMLLASDAPVDVKNAVVRVEFKVFQDEAAKINIDEIKTALMLSGAKEVEVRIIRIPREATRSANILKLNSLREKLVEMANLKQETVPASILAKADMIEAEEADKIIQEVAN